MKLFTVYCLLITLVSGCSYTHQFGQVGPHKMYKVQLGSISGPGQTMFALMNTNTGEVTFMSPMGGNGILSSVTVAGSIVAGSYFIGKGLEKSHGDSTTVNANAQAESAAQSQAEANNAPVINIPDPPQGPLFPRNRPPANRPPNKWK